MTDKNQELVTREGMEKLQEEFRHLTEDRRREIAVRQESDAIVKRRQGILPIRSFCKRIRDDDGK